eukprot:8697438-Lingulodinium_polyedra.AAC.1
MHPEHGEVRVGLMDLQRARGNLRLLHRVVAGQQLAQRSVLAPEARSADHQHARAAHAQRG